MNDMLQITFGGLADPIEKQLNAQGFTLGDYTKVFQIIQDGVTMGYAHGVITDSECDRIMNRYMKLIKKRMQPLKKEGDE